MSTTIAAPPTEAAGDASKSLREAFQAEGAARIRDSLADNLADNLAVDVDLHMRAVRFECIRLEEENAAFRAFIDYCASQPGCPFGASARAIQQKWAKVERA